MKYLFYYLSHKQKLFFYPLKGIIDNSYQFSFDSEQKVLLDLIIDDKKIDINKINNEIVLKRNEFQKSKNNISFN